MYGNVTIIGLVDTSTDGRNFTQPSDIWRRHLHPLMIPFPLESNDWPLLKSSNFLGLTGPARMFFRLYGEATPTGAGLRMISSLGTAVKESWVCPALPIL